MKSVLVVGLGRFGRTVIKKLNELGHEVMAIDNDEERVQSVMPYVDNAQIGDSTDRVFLESLGIPDFDLCIVTIGDDFLDSLETTSLLKELGAQKVVARASRDRYEKFLLRNGADYVVYPEREMAEWTAIRYSADHVFEYIELDAESAIVEIEVPHEWINKSLGQLAIRQKYHVNVLAMRDHGRLRTDLNADTVFVDGTRVLILGFLKDLQKFLRG